MLQRIIISIMCCALLSGCGAAKHPAIKSAPVIGVSAGGVGQSRVVDAYIDAVEAAGGIPVIIPIMTDKAALSAILDKVDGILMTGGEDIDPHFFGEEPIPELGEVNAPRDTFDVLLCQMTVAAKKPMLAICRGMQVLNVAFGGTLWQDIPSQLTASSVYHKAPEGETALHPIEVASGSVLAKILPPEAYETNSFHHQAVKDVAEGFVVNAVAADGVIEGIERFASGDRILAVQFHPEKSLAAGNRCFLPLFGWLVAESQK